MSKGNDFRKKIKLVAWAKAIDLKRNKFVVLVGVIFLRKSNELFE